MTERLAGGVASVSELAEPFDLTLPAVTKHLGVLEHAGLVRGWKQGRVRYVQLAPEPLERALTWITHYRGFWLERFAGLHEHLGRDQGA
jgi:DNA-binding transcriptional ArsR family regulator